MISRDNPCKPDCRGRHGGCQIGCPHWAAYVANRNADYEEKFRTAQAERDFCAVTARSHGSPAVEHPGERVKTRQLR